MKKTVFVRPDLRLFLLAALLIVVVNDLFVGLHIQASARLLPTVATEGAVTDEDLVRLRQHLVQYPSAEGYVRLSYCYQQRGQLKRAMRCLWRANHLSELETTED